MVRAKCPNCGLKYPKLAGHLCAGEGEPPANDNPADKVVPFNDKEWRRAYMRRYMRERRLRKALEAAE